jgi:ribosomal protein L31E
MEGVSETKVNEITVNLRSIGRGSKSNKKASGTVKRLKRFVQKQWKTSVPVHISEELNSKIWSRGNSKYIGKVRIRVERGACTVNPEKKCIRLSLVDVLTFKNLKDSIVEE